MRMISNNYYEDCLCGQPCGAEPMGCSSCDLSFTGCPIPDSFARGGIEDWMDSEYEEEDELEGDNEAWEESHRGVNI